MAKRIQERLLHKCRVTFTYPHICVSHFWLPQASGLTLSLISLMPY